MLLLQLLLTSVHKKNPSAYSATKTHINLENAMCRESVEARRDKLRKLVPCFVCIGRNTSRATAERKSLHATVAVKDFTRLYAPNPP